MIASLKITALVLVSVASCALIAVASASQLDATIVDGSGKPLPDAIVYLAPKQPVPAAPATKIASVDQVDKEFVPRISVVQTGSSLRFPNRDNIRHQVYSFSPAKVFTLKLYSGTPSDPIVLDKSGVIVLGCNIHDHMVAWILSVETPWFGQADAGGHATVGSVPAGQYELLAWHPGVAKPVSLGAVQFDGNNRIDRKVALQITSVSTGS